MAEAVDWLADGTPRSARFGDIYRSASGGLAQAGHVFLHGCGLPAAWAGQPQWRILETGFGLGLNFLAAWRAWKDDERRPRILHFASVEAWPVAAEDILRSAAASPGLASLAEMLAAQWIGLMPGVHRLVFDGGRVLLTLTVGDVAGALREPAFAADSVFLDGFDPERNPQMWTADVFKGVARHCRRGSALATWTVAGEVRRGLAQSGFRAERADGLPPKRHCLRAVFDPSWDFKRAPPATVAPARCIVVGAGLAGAAAAASLARRGWDVTVVDEAPAPAAALLREGEDWRRSGVLEHRPGRAPRVGPDVPDAAGAWTRPADAMHKSAAGLPAGIPAAWHELAAWISPAALVRAWLAQPGIAWCARTHVRRVARTGDAWRLLGHDDAVLGEAELVVLAAAQATASLLEGRLPLQPVRGQVSWGFDRGELRLPPFPVNGNGHFLAGVPLGRGSAWLCGSTYGRGDCDTDERDADHRSNFEKLTALLPDVAGQLAPQFTGGSVGAWTGVRCASADRRPCLGEMAPGLWVSTAMGSRGLTFAALCGELLAARLHGEPLPLDRRLADALDTARLKRQPPLHDPHRAAS